jgi:hypothetical protein
VFPWSAPSREVQNGHKMGLNVLYHIKKLFIFFYGFSLIF